MSRSTAPRTTAEPGAGRADRAPGPLARLQERVERVGATRLPVTSWFVLLGLALAALVCAMVPVGPTWLGGVGAVSVAAAYSWALAARTGGRPVLFGTLAAVLGAAVLVLDQDPLRTGAAVMTCVISAVLAVITTVPAVTFARAARECVLAVAVAAVGALATVGFEPQIAVVRFEYATFGLALVAAFAVVYRLGAGLHGLGRRGLVIVVVGGVLLSVTLLYAELLRRYGATDVVDSLLDGVRWSRDNLGAFPRPIASVLGIPALAYGCHMRARRRQGWWVCAFGVAGTSAVANSLVNPAIAFQESALSVVYGLVVGLVLGYGLIRLDYAVSGTSGRSARRGGRSAGRRSRAAEEESAVRPEPSRGRPLL